MNRSERLVELLTEDRGQMAAAIRFLRSYIDLRDHDLVATNRHREAEAFGRLDKVLSILAELVPQEPA